MAATRAADPDLDDDDMPLHLRLVRRKTTSGKLLLVPVTRKKPKPRWMMANIPDSELTMWELCMRNRRQLTEEEKKAKRQKKEAERIGEQKAQEERQLMLSELGPEADEGVIDLFNATGTAANSGDPGGGDDFYEFMTFEANNTATLTPFAGAYKKTKGARWSTADTNEFYKTVALFGTDAMLIHTKMPQFTEQQIVTKINREAKANAAIFQQFASGPKRLTSNLDAR